jgi:uncharacterized protein (UPF0332 family)
MDQKYKDSLIHSVKIDELDNDLNEWWERSEICARRILTAICFREQSNRVFVLTESRIFPNIGYYYALFHMSVAILVIDYSTELKNFRRIPHKVLINMIGDKLIKRSVIPVDYLELLLELKRLREDTNYSFKTNFKTEIYYKEVGKLFNIAIKFIKEVSNVIENSFPLLLRICTEIGDGFGDDTLQAFLSDEDQDHIWKYLLKNELTN